MTMCNVMSPAAVCAFVLCSAPVTSGYCPEHAQGLAEVAGVTAPTPHPTILRRAVLLCSLSAPERVVECNRDGRCPVHQDGACALWYVPWPDAERSAKGATK